MHRTVTRYALTAALAVGSPQLAGGLLASLESRQAPEQESPFAGTWIANIEKSKRHSNHQFQSATMEIAVSANTVSLTYRGVNAGGKEESGTTVLEADGQEHPVPGQPGLVVVTRWSGPRLLQTVAKIGGKTAGESSYEVSAEGKTLTATVSGTDASGSRFEQVIVFDRK